MGARGAARRGCKSRTLFLGHIKLAIPKKSERYRAAVNAYKGAIRRGCSRQEAAQEAVAVVQVMREQQEAKRPEKSTNGRKRRILPMPPRPDSSTPGTEARIAVLESRRAAGLHIWHPQDKTWQPDRTTFSTVIAAQKGHNNGLLYDAHEYDELGTQEEGD